MGDDVTEIKLLFVFLGAGDGRGDAHRDRLLQEQRGNGRHQEALQRKCVQKRSYHNEFFLSTI